MLSPTIGRIPGELKGFFTRLRRHVRAPVFRHLRGYVLAVAVATGKRDVKTLHRWLPQGACRQNLTDFLIAAPWEPETLLEAAARQVLADLRLPPRTRLYLIVDASKKTKRGTQMDGAHRFYVPMGGRCGFGHEFVLATLRVGDVCVPWAVKLFVPKAFARSPRGQALGVRHQTFNALAADILAAFPEALVRRYDIVVLFDAGFFNETVVDACTARGLTYIGRAQRNRAFRPETGGGERSCRTYGPGVVRYSGEEIRLPGSRGQSRYRVAVRDGTMRKVGAVRVVFSRRLRDRRAAILVTNDRTLSARAVVDAYRQRWGIETLFKQLKQHLGLGDYRTSAFTGVVRHLHLVCLANLVLTHLGLTGSRRTDRARAATPMPKLPSVPVLQAALRARLWGTHATGLKRRRNGSAVLRALRRLLPEAA